MTGCPFITDRRRLLMGLGLGAIGTLAPAAQAREAAQPNVDDAPHGHAETAAQSVPFHGPHQAGIVTPRPANGIVAAFDVVAASLDDVETMLRLLTERAAFLTQGGAVPERDPRLPPADSGLLGPVVAPDNQTITLALGDSFFEAQPALKPLKPARLQRMVQFPNDALEADICHGDIVLQFCANLQDSNIHALRDIVKNLSEYLVLRWVYEGSVPPVPPAPDGSTPSARNFLGFRDGSANPDANDAEMMGRVVWTAAPDEPAWAHGGSYQAVRIIRNFVERWDRTPLREQERIFGRAKNSGAPLDGGPKATERDVPDYAADPDGAKTAMNSHIRLANPRTPDADKHLILRRPFNYARGAMKNGHLDQGLLFIAWQADLQQGFIAVQNLLNGEPLEEYIKPVGGGYFFAPPGVAGPEDYLGSGLIDAARRA
ncbi:deferrochelatase/peroxidase EfeB [Paracoccus limosus]|uniref:Deferrochelatase n=1 Tax=Paracoccus limosus TaxID=913252 RepID=A0A844H581_9RHOB|nr:iron uptake transporter deferrochelatase/peroxidase subunit [Paracoccus limosus]MTH34600.1 deferrochelatase/peroxidase EfeB [Paracoccus limosus]